MDPRGVKSPERLVFQARAAWWEDGLAEMVSGIGLVVIGLLGWRKATLPPEASTPWDLAWTLAVLVFAVGGPFVVRWLKARWVWPRTGYAKPRRERSLGVILGFLLALGVLALLLVWNPPFLGPLWAGGTMFLLLFSWYRYARVFRFLVIGIVILLLSGILAFLQISAEVALFLTLAFTGLAFLVTGTQAWIRFQKQQPAEAGNG